MIQLEALCRWVQEVECSRLPPPRWREDKGVFEYDSVGVEIVAFLKAVRAVQSLNSLPVLCERGLLYDFYTIIRCVIECTDQIHFLLEQYPNTSSFVDQFVRHFSSTTIENAKVQEHHGVRASKITAAAARARMRRPGPDQLDEETKRATELIRGIWTAICNSVHSNYADIMQAYGPRGAAQFQLRGIPDVAFCAKNAAWIPAIHWQVAEGLRFLAQRLALSEIELEIRTALLNDA